MFISILIFKDFYEDILEKAQHQPFAKYYLCLYLCFSVCFCVTYFGKDVADRVPFMLRTLVYIWICLVFIAFVLISRPDKEDIVEPSEEESEDEDINASPVMSESGKRFEMSGNDIKTSNDGGS